MRRRPGRLVRPRLYDRVRGGGEAPLVEEADVISARADRSRLTRGPAARRRALTVRHRPGRRRRSRRARGPRRHRPASARRCRPRPPEDRGRGRAWRWRIRCSRSRSLARRASYAAPWSSLTGRSHRAPRPCRDGCQWHRPRPRRTAGSAARRLRRAGPQALAERPLASELVVGQRLLVECFGQVARFQLQEGAVRLLANAARVRSSFVCWARVRPSLVASR